MRNDPILQRRINAIIAEIFARHEARKQKKRNKKNRGKKTKKTQQEESR